MGRAQLRQEVRVTMCQHCEREEGKAYKYYYGKEVSRSGLQNYGTGWHTSRTFKIMGSGDMVLCPKCISRVKNTKYKVALVAALVAICLFTVGNIFGTALPWPHSPYVLASLSLVVAVLACGGPSHSKDGWGDKAAIRYNRKELGERGMTNFFTREEYAKLHPGNTWNL